MRQRVASFWTGVCPVSPLYVQRLEHESARAIELHNLLADDVYVPRLPAQSERLFTAMPTILQKPTRSV